MGKNKVIQVVLKASVYDLAACFVIGFYNVVSKGIAKVSTQVS